MKIILAAVFVLMIQFNAIANEGMNLVWKLSPEFKLNFGQSDWEARIRPPEYVIPDKIFRWDFMFGRKFGDFKLFSYTKFDNLGEIWTGARVDYNFFAFENKFLLNLQLRYFFGLNEKSPNHVYWIFLQNYELNDIIGVGILGYAKKDEGVIPNWFIGPSTILVFTKDINLHLSLGKDIFAQNLYLMYVRLNWRLKL